MTSETPGPAQPAPQDPVTVEDFIHRAWILQVEGDLPRAEADFRQATQIDGRSAEGFYGLGLSLKLQRRAAQAKEAFEKAIELIGAGALKEDQPRATMLNHLSKWHIETINEGRSQEPEP
jgi:tetratricopeptide (TPR) repeat protein